MRGTHDYETLHSMTKKDKVMSINFLLDHQNILSHSTIIFSFTDGQENGKPQYLNVVSALVFHYVLSHFLLIGQAI